MKHYDINFIGHLCLDETLHADGGRIRTFGGAAVYGAVAAASLGKSIAVELKLAGGDEAAVSFLRSKGIDVLAIPAAETTQVEVSHPGGKIDERRIVTTHYAGKFAAGEVKRVPARHVHLAGCNDHEFGLDFVRAIRSGAESLSIDVQCLVRNNDPRTGEIAFADDPDTSQFVALMDKVKLDIFEAELLCGTDDPQEAARIVQSWGCPEVMITRADGVFVRCGRHSAFAKFSHKSLAGRTGRGDTTFGAYLAARIDHEPAEAAEYAAALVSLKMERPGPFTGTLDDVLSRMKEARGG